MMKRFALCLAILTAFALPAHAHDIDGTEVVFDGAIPCSIVCAYWLDNGFLPCENPFPPGSYVDHITDPAPTAPAGKITLFEATLDPTVDWDSFFCRNDETRAELGPIICICDPQCTLEVGGVLIAGCHEDFGWVLAAGESVIFRAYNWSDALPATGEYSFRSL